ncbi:MAG TPA: AlkA N-terminal domain-containing protein [Xanthomonadales bacterium]|nr:AlkA N-terminal domain-containing protein [Xanthomonadales bacterium]
MATTEKEIFERARLARDVRFDGRFFIGVKTTGIYCRPICPANLPRSENVTFYPTAAAAAENGFRPCLRCRPESAPGTPAWSGTSVTVQRGLRLIASGALDSGDIETLSDRLGVSSRHLRRLFKQHLGASPLAVAHTQRLHFAKQLIDEGQLPLNQVAIAAGYGSVRRFNDTFRNTYNRTPGELRKLRNRYAGKRPSTASSFTVALPFRDPFHWQTILRYFAGRAIPGVESVDHEGYKRTISMEGSDGILEIRNAENEGQLQLTIHGIETCHLFQAVQKARMMLDLDAPINEITKILGQDPLLSPQLKSLPGIRVPGCWDGFELAVRTILGQQISVAGASTMTGRLAAAHGRLFKPDICNEKHAPGLLFPGPENLVDAPLEKSGIISSRATAIRTLARSVLDGAISFDTTQDPESFEKGLTAIKGIGDWTAQYLLMRVLRDPDAFPASDLGLRKSAGAKKPISTGELKKQSQEWRPWRAYAAMLLWQKPDSSGG